MPKAGPTLFKAEATEERDVIISKPEAARIILLNIHIIKARNMKVHMLSSISLLNILFSTLM